MGQLPQCSVREEDDTETDTLEGDEVVYGLPRRRRRTKFQTTSPRQERIEREHGGSLGWLHDQIRLAVTRSDLSGMEIVALKRLYFKTRRVNADGCCSFPISDSSLRQYLDESSRRLSDPNVFFAHYFGGRLRRLDSILNARASPFMFIVTDIAQTSLQHISRSIQSETIRSCGTMFASLPSNSGIDLEEALHYDNENLPFGMFHTAILLGPHKLEWVDHSLIMPSSASSRRPLVGVPIPLDGLGLSRDIRREDPERYERVIRETMIEVSNVIVRWNTGKVYHRNPAAGGSRGNPFSILGNCQQFTKELLACFRCGLEDIFVGKLNSYRNKLRARGKCSRWWRISQIQRDRYQCLANSRKIVFKSHKQLDLIIQTIQDEDSENGRMENGTDFKNFFPNDYSLLRAFDRGFWLQFFRYGPTEKCPLDCDDVALSRPRICEGMFAPDDDICQCPFQNPERLGEISFGGDTLLWELYQDRLMDALVESGVDDAKIEVVEGMDAEVVEET